MLGGSFSVDRAILSCKAKRQYLGFFHVIKYFTLQVSRYCFLALQSSVDVRPLIWQYNYGLVAIWRRHMGWYDVTTRPINTVTQKTGDSETMLFSCCASVADGGPT